MYLYVYVYDICKCMCVCVYKCIKFIKMLLSLIIQLQYFIPNHWGGALMMKALNNVI